MLIGQGNRFELWDEAHWNERRDAWLQRAAETAAGGARLAVAVSVRVQLLGLSGMRGRVAMSSMATALNTGAD